MRCLPSTVFVSTLLLGLSCRQPPPRDWGDLDVLRTPAPGVEYRMGGQPISPEDHAQFLEWGEMFFREGAFGNERSITDVLGVLQGQVDVPCGEDCTESRPVFQILLDAVDALDGTSGNLFLGNGGAYTSNLVLEFPEGTTVFGIPVPSQVHTGLEVEAGEVMPIGVFPVPAPPDEAELPWLLRPKETGMEGAPDGAFRVRLSCAACHYSLDIDQDGAADMRSTRSDQPTPGSPYKPHHGWAVGNQDIDFGWIVALSANPLLTALVIGGDIHDDSATAPRDFARWVHDNLDDEQGVHHRVIQSVLVQPRGWADVSSDARFNTIQIPPLYSQGAWPANSNGAIFDDADRNSTVWTGALDFTGLIGLCKERSASLPWEPPGAFNELRCDEFADVMLRYSPAGRAGLADAYAADILGEDGVPGMMDPDSMVVFQLTGSMPDEVWNNPANEGRRREPSDYGDEARIRHTTLGLLGTRIAVPPDFRAAHDTDAIAARIGTHPDEFVSDTVSVMLDWLEPPPLPSTRVTAELVERGQEVFRASGCAECHGGPFLTDNAIHWLGEDPMLQYGGHRTPSTAGWRVLHRGRGPAIGTQPSRTVSSRTVRRFASAEYDPKTGKPVIKAGAIQGLLGVREIGYKTPPLRGLWASAPYLHDGGVAVSLRSDASEASSLSQHLSRSASEVWFGAGAFVVHNQTQGEDPIFPDAALSLQALVLPSVRQQVERANGAPTFPIPGERGRKSMQSLGVSGEGHEFWVDDVPGGPDVTALVAFLLAMDDCPGDVLGQPCEPRVYGVQP